MSNLHKDKINKLWAENAFYENSLVGLKFVKFHTTLYIVFIIIRSNFIQMSVNFTLLRAETRGNAGTGTGNGERGTGNGERGTGNETVRQRDDDCTW